MKTTFLPFPICVICISFGIAEETAYKNWSMFTIIREVIPYFVKKKRSLCYDRMVKKVGIRVNTYYIGIKIT